jgi:hypothetical protein
MERPDLKSVKDHKILKYIEHLEAATDILLNNSRAKTFVTLRKQVDSWNEQLQIRDEQRPNPEDPEQMITVKAGYVDLFADKDSKEFDRVWKYIDGLKCMKSLHRRKKKKWRKCVRDRVLSEIYSIKNDSAQIQ